MFAVGWMFDADGGVNYDVRISYVGLNNLTVGWTPVSTSGGTWKFDNDSRATSTITCQGGQLYRATVTRSWRTGSGSGSSSTFSSGQVVC
jgi:hypothetical protein